MEIRAEINGRALDRDAVLAYEDADRRSGPEVPCRGPRARPGRRPPRGPPDDQARVGRGGGTNPRRASFAEIRRRLARQTKVADAVARTTSGVGSRRQFSMTDLYVDGADAGVFVEWFHAASEDEDQTAMLRANPDHFVLRPSAVGQEVIETTGGSPLATAFTVDYDNTSSLLTTAMPDFPLQVAGVALASNGSAIGGVRHQLRDTITGYHARLTVELPLLTAPHMVSAHRWHLACEFSNWAEAAAASA